MNDTTVKIVFSIKAGGLDFPFVSSEDCYCLFINDSNRYPLAKSFINYPIPRLGDLSYINPSCYTSDNIENLFKLVRGALNEQAS